MISSSLYKRIIAGVFIWFFINKIAKRKYLNNGAKDSHEISYRDNTATLWADGIKTREDVIHLFSI